MQTTWKCSITLLAALAVGLGTPGPLGAQQADGEPGDVRAEECECAGPVGAIRMALQARGPRLGVQIEDVDDEDVEALGLPAERGAKVVRVIDGTPAAEAGVREGDVVVRWNGEPVASAAELTRLVRETPADREVRLALVRDGEEVELEVTLEEDAPHGIGARGWGDGPPEAWATGEQAEELHERLEEVRERVAPAMERLRQRLGDLDVELEGFGPGAFTVRVGDGRLGVRLQSLTDQLADYFGVDGGALVAGVREGSPAAEADLRAGDVIVEVDGRATGSPTDVARAVRKASAGPLPVRVVRDGDRRTLTVELPSRDGDEETRDGGEERGGASALRAPSVSPVPPAPPAPDAPRPSSAEAPPAPSFAGASPAPDAPRPPAPPATLSPTLLVV